MTTTIDWLEAVIAVLRTEGERPAWDLLCTLFPRARPATVPLLVGDMSPFEALTYADTLFELGLDRDAEEVLFEVARAATGVAPLSEQRYVQTALGAQAIGDA